MGILLNYPKEAPLGRTNAVGWINPPSVALILICSFLQGIADACLGPQTYAHIINHYPGEESERAFTISNVIFVSPMMDAQRANQVDFSPSLPIFLLQCITRASLASVDPECWSYFELCQLHSGREFLLTMPHTEMVILQ